MLNVFLAALLAVSVVGAYEVEFGPGVEDRERLQSYVDDYNQSELLPVYKIVFVREFTWAGFYHTGDVVMISSVYAESESDFVWVMRHELTHLSRWNSFRDLSHGKGFKEELRWRNERA